LLRGHRAAAEGERSSDAVPYYGDNVSYGHFTSSCETYFSENPARLGFNFHDRFISFDLHQWVAEADRVALAL
jgi:hypothetical protein